MYYKRSLTYLVVLFGVFTLSPLLTACTSHKAQRLPSEAERLTIQQPETESIKELGHGWFEVTGTAVIQNISPQEAEKQAIYNACRDAIQYYSGVEITERTVDLQGVGRKKVLLDHFCALSTQTTNGIIVEKEILQKEITTDGSNLITVVVLKVKVGKQKGKKDPYFTVTAQLNRDAFRDGEKLELIARASKDCYITVLNICSNNRVYILFPNTYRRDNFLKANEVFRLPDEHDRSMGVSYPVKLLTGKDEDVEMIKILATKENISFAVSQTLSEYGTYEMALKQLLKQLIEIPRHEMAELDIQYFVTRTW